LCFLLPSGGFARDLPMLCCLKKIVLAKPAYFNMKMEVELSLVGGYPCYFDPWFTAPPNRLKLTFNFNFSLQERVELVIFVI